MSAETLPRTERRPTRADLEALPAGVKGELIEGVLYAMARPRPQHQVVGGLIHASLVAPFHRGRGGPGGWLILPEPGIDLPTAPEISPDVAGWRRERLPSVSSESIKLVPDWVCEILSPTTRRHDLLVKVPYYARVGVPHLWLVDLEARTLQVCRSGGGFWTTIATLGDQSEARLPPFDEVTIDVAAYWQDLTAVASP